MVTRLQTLHCLSDYNNQASYFIYIYILIYTYLLTYLTLPKPATFVNTFIHFLS